MERKNFRKLWAERTLNTALLRHWVGAIVLFFVTLFSLPGLETSGGKTFLLCGDFVIPDDDAAVACAVLVGVGAGSLLLWQKYFKLKKELSSSKDINIDPYERGLEERSLLGKQLYFLFYCMSVSFLFVPLLRYVNYPSKDKCGQVQRSEVLSVSHPSKEDPKICFPVMVDGKRVVLEMRQPDPSVHEGAKLSVTVLQGNLGWPVVTRISADQKEDGKLVR